MRRYGFDMDAISMFYLLDQAGGGVTKETPVVSEAAAQSAQTATYHFAFRASAHVPCLKSTHDFLG